MGRSALAVCRTRLGEERGQAVVELALVMPLLLLLLLGAIDFGKAYNAWIDETHLANEGARLAAVNAVPATVDPPCAVTPVDTIQKYIWCQLDTSELKSTRAAAPTAPGQNPAQACISFPNGGTPKVGDPVRVTVSVNYAWLRFTKTQTGSAATTSITGSSTMRLEQAPSNFSAGCYP
jgi:Flp pilus assembly protein TadG